ncbi:MAG: carboxylase, partial [Deltaproteobacteria bacterium]|nr:carboxylase [Deltaproteobacteria bacterium]
MSKNIYFVDMTLRDGHQSLWATRMTTAMMLPIAKAMDEVGYQRTQVMGLPQVSACLYYLRENPFERMRLIARAMPHTPIGTGGGSSHIGRFQISPDSVANLWMRLWAEAGAKYTSIVDALGSNFPDMIRMAKAATALGQKTSVALVFALSPVHTDEYYAQKAAEMVSALAPDIFWIKDSMGLLTPERTRTLVPAILKNIGEIPLEFHSHCNNGLAPLCCLEAVRLGVKGVHTC